MASMRDVKRIYLDERGISHIVASEKSGWVHLLCDVLIIGAETSDWPLKPRICRKCRKRLKTATLHRKPEPVESEADQAIAQCERIIGVCDELPERGEEFADSVREKVESIHDWIEENNHVTEAQQAALDNMEDGVSAWLNR